MKLIMNIQKTNFNLENFESFPGRYLSSLSIFLFSTRLQNIKKVEKVYISLSEIQLILNLKCELQQVIK